MKVALNSVEQTNDIDRLSTYWKNRTHSEPGNKIHLQLIFMQIFDLAV